MRTTPNSHITDLWNNGGPFIGVEGAPHGRVTVEIGWTLRTSGSSANVGAYTKGPIRWFQRKNNIQDETEIPNIKTITIDRSIDTDAATCNITMANQQMFPNTTGSPGDMELGQPGFYTFSRGESTDAQTRWSHVTNEWNQVLVPNALLRTYQGYGGKDKTLAQALADGNIIQTGLWLIDDVNPKAGNQELEIKCRDMGKLVIEQSLYPPLVPRAQYPMNYYRFVNEDHPVIPYGTTVYGFGYTGTPAGQTSQEAPTIEVNQVSSAAAGHPGSDACDFGDPDSYWLSNGHTVADSTADMEYIQFAPIDPSGTITPTSIGAFDIFPWGGGYHYYVSVRVGGTWQGSNTIPATGASASMAIPYVNYFTGTGWEQPALHGLADEYANVGLIRFTFRNLARSNIGPQFYRAGIRDISVGVYTSTITGGGRTIQGIVRPTGTDSDGYWLAGTDGGVFSFGTAKFHGSLGGTVLNAEISGIASKGDGTGYWLSGADGGVFAFGDAHYYGNAVGVTPATFGGLIVGIERAAAGAGYYLVNADGAVYAYGAATYHGGGVGGTYPCVGMAVCTGGGYRLVNDHGQVYNYGVSAISGGNASTSTARNITSTSTGNGYWIVAADGAVFAFGDAGYHGGANTLGPLNDPITDIEGFDDDSGYWLVGADGGVFTYGAGHHFHGSLPQSYSIETAGNYSDYSDIIKDLLLWSGFWLYDPALGAGDPEVFGNIESTGAFAQTNLDEAFFDKKPVIDVIHTIREIVGYLALVDDQGGFHFESPNIYSIGNYMDNGTPTAVIPEIDEAIQMTDYTVGVSDKSSLSSITISSENPDFRSSDTITTTIDSVSGQARLKGIVKNALWINQEFLSADEQKILADLVDLFTIMAERQGQVSCAANPIICLNDQVRVWERQTSDTYIHYVRGISTSMDLVTGEYNMTVTTHWLGDGTTWFLQY